MLLLNPIENDFAILFRIAMEKRLCYFVPYGRGILVLRFAHGSAKKCIINGVHISGRNRRGK